MMAQGNQPTVEIIVSRPTASQGDIISADVYIRDAVDMGGAEVGIRLDEECLRILDYEPGDFLPTTADEGGFIAPGGAIRDHEMQIEVGIFDRSKRATGDGILFRINLLVTCERGTAPLEVTIAELTAYRDPEAAVVEVDTYTLGKGNVTIVNAEVEIVEATAAPPTATPTATYTPTPTITPTATRTPTPAPTRPPAPEKPRDPIVSVFIAPIGCVALFLLGTVFLVVRRLGREGGI